MLKVGKQSAIWWDLNCTFYYLHKYKLIWLHPILQVKNSDYVIGKKQVVIEGLVF